MIFKYFKNSQIVNNEGSYPSIEENEELEIIYHVFGQADTHINKIKKIFLF